MTTKAEDFVEMIKQVIAQYDEGAITAEECQNYITVKAVEVAG